MLEINCRIRSSPQMAETESIQVCAVVLRERMAFVSTCEMYKELTVHALVKLKTKQNNKLL